MKNLPSKLEFSGSELEFTKSVMKLNILVDLMSKELNLNYKELTPGYKKNLKGIAKTFEHFKSQVNSSSTWAYGNLSFNQTDALFTLSEEIENIINGIIDDIYK